VATVKNGTQHVNGFTTVCDALPVFDVRLEVNNDLRNGIPEAYIQFFLTLRTLP
jgi:hypothetical protein